MLYLGILSSLIMSFNYKHIGCWEAGHMTCSPAVRFFSHEWVSIRQQKAPLIWWTIINSPPFIARILHQKQAALGSLTWNSSTLGVCNVGFGDSALSLSSWHDVPVSTGSAMVFPTHNPKTKDIIGNVCRLYDLVVIIS